MMFWYFENGFDEEAVGIIPLFLQAGDKRGAVEQIDEHYAHGGGWRDFEGFTLKRPSEDKASWYLQYPDDPPMRLVAHSQLRDETILIFEYAWVAVVQSDGSYKIARID